MKYSLATENSLHRDPQCWIQKAKGGAPHSGFGKTGQEKDIPHSSLFVGQVSWPSFVHGSGIISSCGCTNKISIYLTVHYQI